MSGGTAGEPFARPSGLERVFNRLFGALVGLGFGLRHNYLLEVRGRSSGRLYSMPVNLLESGGRRYLVAPRGYTQWVRNVHASAEVSLRKGRHRERCHVSAVPDEEKPEVLKAYLDRFTPTVQRYFPVPAGSPASAFRSLAARYPVFELRPT